VIEESMSATPNPSPTAEAPATDASEDHEGAPIEFLNEAVTPGPIDLGPLEEVHIKLAQLAVRTVSELKIEDIKVVDVRGRTSYCDLLVLCTASSERQLRAAASLLVSTHKGIGRGRPLGVEGQDSGRWALIDMGDVLVHVFYAQWRGYYDLDGLWMDADRVSMSELGLTEEGLLPRSDAAEE
jgi:ribosome-associated protein